MVFAGVEGFWHAWLNQPSRGDSFSSRAVDSLIVVVDGGASDAALIRCFSRGDQTPPCQYVERGFGRSRVQPPTREMRAWNIFSRKTSGNIQQVHIRRDDHLVSWHGDELEKRLTRRLRQPGYEAHEAGGWCTNDQANVLSGLARQLEI